MFLKTWQEILRKNFIDAETLFQFLELDERAKAKLYASPKFPLNVPYRLAQKMGKNDLKDPLFRQFVPLLEEQTQKKGDSLDPLDEHIFRKEPKLLCKYKGRALILTTSSCAMNCRFCFRQNFDYEKEQKGFDLEIEKISQDSTISEVLLSGGDPLSL